MNALLEIAAHPAEWIAFCRAAKKLDCPPTKHRRWFADWSGSVRSGASPLADEKPWMTFAAAEFLDCWLDRGMNVFEWGSGGSTIFFASRANHVTAVEHEEAWAVQVRAAISQRGIANAQVEHLPPERDENSANWDAADPSYYASCGEAFRGYSFQKYVTFIDRFSDASLDLVVVDGRARPACIQRGMSKLKPGGFLLLDNAERCHYQRSRAMLDSAHWDLHDFTGPGPYCGQFWQTLGWRKKM